mmetsp:Transcript_7909/g.29199  ORF Transcript_7909/g.29199 Transcript_7909/m.29199 type:complete len:403 (-) Transcript_7909:164-1372(-)
MTRAPSSPKTRRVTRSQNRNRCTAAFWDAVCEGTRLRLLDMHGGGGGGDWTTRSSSHDVDRAIVLARRDALANESLRSPPNFVKDQYAPTTHATRARVRNYLSRWGFRARVAGQVPAAAVAKRLAITSGIDFTRIRDHGRLCWNRQFQRLFGRIQILDIGCGTKSWTRWLNHCVHDAWRGQIVIVTIDIEEKMRPDIRKDITKWRQWLRTELKRLGHERTRWHIVSFASECTEFCPLKNKLNKQDEERDLVGATWLAQSGMMMIIELQPLVWFIECSGAGGDALKTQKCMDCPEMRARLVDLTLCNAGADIQKDSSWWTNLPRDIYSVYGFPETSCAHAGGRKCLWKMLFACHMRHVGGGRGPTSITLPATREESMQYPPMLCAQWIASAVHAMLYYESVEA